MRLLLAEDEHSLSRAVVKILKSNRYEVDAVDNGSDALEYLLSGNYDAAVLDIMMPKMDGITVLKEIRKSGSRIPVLLLTAKTEINDRVSGLDCGANDYLTKPFDTRELLARIRAMTRSQAADDSKLFCGNICLDRSTFELSSPSGCFRLTNKEFQMLELMMTNNGHPIAAQRFFEKIWGNEKETESEIVWIYISYLRKKLDALHADLKISADAKRKYTLQCK